MKKIFINKRKRKYFGVSKKLFFFLILTLSLLIVYYNNSKKLFDYSIISINKFSDIYKYNLNNVEVENLEFLTNEEITFSFNPYMEKSIFLVPTKKIAENILNNKWVKNIRIKSNYKNTINVYVEEEKPMGIYDNQNQKLLFSKDLIILEVIKDVKKYENLIVFFGENSLKNSKKLLLNFDRKFYSTIKSAFFVKNRRWNILLKNNILLKLPENSIDDAVINYRKIYSNFSNNDLKNIETIDFRINKQVYIKYKTIND